MSATVAAAVALQRMIEEEEEMTKYTNADLDGWEFKILRSASGAFNSAQEFNKALQEESVHGWELVEKFDNYRIRLKRRVETRTRINTNSAIEPYRTSYGITDGRIAVYVILGIVLCFVLAGILISLFT